MKTALAREERPAQDFTEIRQKVHFQVIKGMSIERLPLSEYLPQAWPIIEPVNALLPNWHIDCICEHLEAVELGQILRLCINVLPRSGKSSIVSTIWPTQAWTIRPWQRWIFGSYSKELSTHHSIARRRIMDSQWYQDRWGSVVRLQPDQNRKDVFENTARGAMYSTSVGGSVTGMGADIEVFDDFLNPKEAESKAEREKAIREFDQSFSSRLNDKKTGRMVIVEQRTHVDDLTGHVLKQGGWKILILPAQAETKTMIEFPISKRQVVREVGDILQPDREGEKELAQAKMQMGSRAYSAQYQQNPSSDVGNMIKRHWWMFYSEDPTELAGHMDILIQTWDLAFKDAESSSWVEGIVMGRKGADIFIFDEVHEHLDFPATQKAVTRVSHKWPKTGHKLIEDKANGPAIIASLKRIIAGLIPVQTHGSKEARIAAATPPIESGNVYLPDPKRFSWVNDFIEECAHAPMEPNDRPDALAQGINMLMNIRVVREDIEEPEPMFEDDEMESLL